MINVLLGGFTAACLFCAALLFGVGLAAVIVPRIRDAIRKMRKHKVEAAAIGVVLAALVYYGGAKQTSINAGADDGIVLAGVNVDYDSTNDVSAVAVLFTSGNVTVDTPVSVRNSESEEWRELVKQNAEITTDLSTNILAFTVWGNPATNRYWWVGVDTPAVIIESEGIKITHFAASSHSVHIAWTCDDPKATVFSIQRKRKKPAGIPYDAEVEYLQSSGTQYIDTGVYSNGGMVRYELDFRPSSAKQQDGVHQGYFGLSNNGSRWFGVAATTLRSRGIGIGLGQSAIWTGLPSVNRYVVAVSSGSATVNGESVGTAGSIYLARTGNLYLFAVNSVDVSGVSSVSPQDCRVYKLKIYGSDSALVRDFQPVRKSGTGYMYDRVSGQLFGNNGTGAFIYGGDTFSYDVETVGTTTSNSFQYDGFTVGESWEWRVIAVYPAEEAAP